MASSMAMINRTRAPRSGRRNHRRSYATFCRFQGGLMVRLHATLAVLILVHFSFVAHADTIVKAPDPSSATAKAPATFKVKLSTTKGDFVIEVHRDWAPLGA